jgi:hypothetical protein
LKPLASNLGDAMNGLTVIIALYDPKGQSAVITFF